MPPGTLAGILCSIVGILVYSTVHQVPEGFVGVYYRGGALLGAYSRSGFNFKLPLITSVSYVQTTIQTDEVVNIPCGTRGGVLIYFEKIEVVNQLAEDHAIETTRLYGLDYDKIWIFDKIHHEINQFCSAHTLQEVYIDKFDTIDESLQTYLQSDCQKYKTGISIHGVRVTKPKIPEAVRRNYEKMEAEKTRLMVVMEHHKVVEMETQTESKVAMIEAAKNAEVSAIHKSQQVMEKECAQKIAAIEDSMHLAREKAIADADAYKLEMEATAHDELLSPEYMDLLRIQSRAGSSVFYGDAIPKYMTMPSDRVSSSRASSTGQADVPAPLLDI